MSQRNNQRTCECIRQARHQHWGRSACGLGRETLHNPHVELVHISPKADAPDQTRQHADDEGQNAEPCYDTRGKWVGVQFGEEGWSLGENIGQGGDSAEDEEEHREDEGDQIGDSR